MPERQRKPTMDIEKNIFASEMIYKGIYIIYKKISQFDIFKGKSNKWARI